MPACRRQGAAASQRQRLAARLRIARPARRRPAGRTALACRRRGIRAGVDARLLPRGRGGRFATIRVDRRWPGWYACGCAAAGALMFAVAAGWRRIPSPSATASGSPNRLLCPDPVRHMSVISGSVELTIRILCWSAPSVERVADAGPAGCSRRSAWSKRMQNWSAGKGRTGSENPARAQLPC
jgi:hypothetical protein